MTKNDKSASLLSKFGLTIILIAFIMLGLLYDFTVPLFEKPDELKHFAVIQYIRQTGHLPIVRAGVYKPWDQEGTQPPLYHLLAAGLALPLDLSHFEEPPRNPHYVDERSFIWRERGNNNLYMHPPNEMWYAKPDLLAARLARWLSLVAGAVTIMLTYKLARLILTNASPWLPLTAAGVVAFIPQFLHVSAAITNDSLSATLAAAALLSMARIIKQGSSMRGALWLGLILGAGAITKLSLLSLAPLTGLALLIDLRHHRSIKQLLSEGIALGGMMALVAGWWYWRNWQLYGDITALNAHLLYRGGALTPTPSLIQIWQTELTGLELSFWAAFGAGQILLEPWLYDILRSIKYILFIGLGIGVWRELYSSKFNVSGSTLSLLGLLILWAIIIFVALLRWMQITPASWGRLLYPALPSMAVMTVWALSQFKIERSHPKLKIPGAFCPLTLAGLLFLLAVVSPFRYTNAAYAKTLLATEADLPSNLEPINLIYDDILYLHGFTVETSSVRPGDWLAVTLYWQAIGPVDKNYSAYVHLLGQNNSVIGQSNSYPDQGRWATSMLPPGRMLKDTHYAQISADAEAPAVIRLALGIFEFDDPDRAAKPAANQTGDRVEPIVGAIPLIPQQWPTLTPTQPLTANFGGKIELIGYDWGNAALSPGETAPLTLYWQTLAPPRQNLNLFIHLINPVTGAQVAGFDGPPSFSTQFWQPGYTIKDQRQLSLPADLPSGHYELRLGWYNLTDFARLPLQTGGDNLLLIPVEIRQK